MYLTTFYGKYRSLFGIIWLGIYAFWFILARSSSENPFTGPATWRVLMFVSGTSWLYLSGLLKVFQLFGRHFWKINVVSLILFLLAIIIGFCAPDQGDSLPNTSKVLSVLSHLIIIGWPLNDLFDLFYQFSIKKKTP